MITLPLNGYFIILPICMMYSIQIRDTSVFVKLRPAWEELRSYLTAKGRKRFEVYVCTMAERDYALEMWRLLDPEGNLINPQQLSDRITCVKSGKSTCFNYLVFSFLNATVPSFYWYVLYIIRTLTSNTVSSKLLLHPLYPYVLSETARLVLET